MRHRLVIDGNNLLYAVRARGPVPTVGQETLVRRIAAWAKAKTLDVILVFDGPPPKGGLRRQMTPAGLDVRFSAPASADDVIAQLLQEAPDPTHLRVVSDDHAIRYEARTLGCQTGDTSAFIAELYPAPAPSPPPAGKPADAEKPENLSLDERDHWRRIYGVEGDRPQPFDGFDAMNF